MSKVTNRLKARGTDARRQLLGARCRLSMRSIWHLIAYGVPSGAVLTFNGKPLAPVSNITHEETPHGRR